MDNAFIYSVPGRAKAISDIRHFVPGTAGQLVFDVIARAKYGEQISEKEADLAASILSSYLCSVVRFRADFAEILLPASSIMALREEYDVAMGEYSSARLVAAILGQKCAVEKPLPVFVFESFGALDALASKYQVSLADAEDLISYVSHLNEEFFVLIKELYEYAGMKDAFGKKRVGIEKMASQMPQEEAFRILREMNVFPSFVEWQKNEHAKKWRKRKKRSLQPLVSKRPQKMPALFSM